MKKILFNGLKVGVLGLGRSGIAAANLLKRKGAHVLVSEARGIKEAAKSVKYLIKNIEKEFGGHSKKLLEQDVIVKSPGISSHLPILSRAVKKCIPVWSEIGLALKLITPGSLVAITGTNGKTTTTTLIGEMFKAAARDTVVAGNIGSPLANLTGRIRGKTSVILEISSYQLEDTPEFHPDIALILNITPDHIEHHGSMRKYVDAKAVIFSNQTKKDFCVLNYDDLACRKLAQRCPSKIVFFSRKEKLQKGVYFLDGKIHVNFSNQKYSFAPLLRIPGQHNLENALAATSAAAAAAIPREIIEESIEDFRGVEHRIEYVADIEGVKYVNDSKCTNVDSTRVALESFSSPVWLILGGRDKGSPYTPLKELVTRKVKGILLIGEASRKIHKELSGTTQFYICRNLSNAVRKARSLALPGEIVMLSPACASFDQFKDYEDRGHQFKRLVFGMKPLSHLKRYSVK
ncbi:MAG: UDP-N-acetylmuramoyl-L-alanine--D-glutamate ligase [Elusimicrobiota bacterium]